MEFVLQKTWLGNLLIPGGDIFLMRILPCVNKMKLPTALIESELKTFEDRFKEAAKSRAPLLDRIMRYVVKRKGKQLRPMFVLLSARLCGGITESTYRAASFVEILHTATLVHDDVVDDANERRGFFSVYALWKTKASVLIGDYLFAKGLLLTLENNDYKILHLISDAVRKISEGELLQLEKTRTLNIQEGVYYDIIRSKTASLLASACAAGAWSSSNDEEKTEKMRAFGEYVGMAFQIKDDLFDYASDKIGKPTGNDIKEKKLTLPLIYTLKNCDNETRREIIYIIKNKNTDVAQVKKVADIVTKSGGIQYAADKMNEFYVQAKNILYQFPDNDSRKGLEDLINFVINRKY